MKIPSRKWIIVCAALLVLALVCMGVQTSLAGRLLSQRAAERWGGESDMEFRQLSAFLTEDGGKTENDIYTFRQTLLGKFTEASLETPENGSLFSDAWSGEGKVRINSDKTGTEAQVLGVGGDYFLFHPLTLLSGSSVGILPFLPSRFRWIMRRTAPFRITAAQSRMSATIMTK